MILALLALIACKSDPAADDSGGDSPEDSAADDTGVPEGQQHALLVTIASDYSVGTLAVATLDDHDVTDEITAISSDPGVVVDADKAIVLARYGFNSARIYTPGIFDSPLVDFSTGEDSNPHDAEICGGKLFISKFGADAVGVFDPATGMVAGEVDLSAYAPEGGAANPDDLTEVGGKVYVGMLAYADWVPGAATVAEIDCSTSTITGTWTDLRLPSVEAWGDEVLVLSGDEVMAIDPVGRGIRTVVSTELGLDFVDVAVHEDKAIILAFDSSYASHLVCADLSAGTADLVESPATYLPDVTGNERGEAWIADRSFDGSTDHTRIWDIATCTQTGTVKTALPPSSAAFY